MTDPEIEHAFHGLGQLQGMFEGLLLGITHGFKMTSANEFECQIKELFDETIEFMHKGAAAIRAQKGDDK